MPISLWFWSKTAPTDSRDLTTSGFSVFLLRRQELSASSPTLSCRLSYIILLYQCCQKKEEVWLSRILGGKSIKLLRAAQQVLGWSKAEPGSFVLGWGRGEEGAGLFHASSAAQGWAEGERPSSVQPPEAKSRGSRWGFSRTFLIQLFPTGEQFSQETDPVQSCWHQLWLQAQASVGIVFP